MQLVNIHSKGRKVYLFIRDDNGNIETKIDEDFMPYFYEPDIDGEYLGYDNTVLRKVLCSDPKSIVKTRSKQSFESDVTFTRRYMIDKVDKIDKTKMKYLFLDIEVLCGDTFPEPAEAKFPVSCISVYNSFTEGIETFYLGDYESEEKLLEAFMDYIKKEQPDMLLAWNMDFDYIYLHNRIEDFSNKISPLEQSRYGKKDKKEKVIWYPAGISIVDYLGMFKKVNLREQSYALDNVAQKYLKEDAWAKTDFKSASEEVKEKNINDVVRMVKLEKMFNLISYFDEIRRLTKCHWEDIFWNSRLIEAMLFQEAHKKEIVLPNKQQDNIDESFQGATRDIAGKGVYRNITKYDLSGAYPTMIVNFCLDAGNVVETMEDDVVEICGTKFKQKSDALLPDAVRRMLTLKKDIGQELKEAKADETQDTLVAKQRYDGIKGIVNSTFGVFGNKYFRLFDKRITSSITFLVRDVLHYCKDKLEAQGDKVIYWDTDSVFVDSKEVQTDQLNAWIQEWAQQYGKESIDLAFEYEGIFTDIFILGKCHYFGNIKDPKGDIEPEIKGVAMKRSSSSKFEMKFQEELFIKVLAGDTKEVIIKWITEQQDKLRNLDIKEIGFPCKITDKVYKNIPIFVRALKNSQKRKPSFKMEDGQLFYYIYVAWKPLGKDKDDKKINVLAFDDKNLDIMDKIELDWKEMNRRSILTKTTSVFEALDWGNPKEEIELKPLLEKLRG